MTVVGNSSCFLLFLVSVHFEICVRSVWSCSCYSCKMLNHTGDCMNTSACELIAAGNNASTTGTDHTKRISATSDSYPTPFYSCNDNCSTNDTTFSSCLSSIVDQTTPPSKTSRDSVLKIICASVVPSAGAVLVLIVLLAYCRMRQMEKRKKEPPKMLPKVEDIDASIRAASSAIVPEDQEPPSKIDMELSDAASGNSISGVKRSQSLRNDKEDWTPPGISKADPSSAEPTRLSVVATDKTKRKAETQPTYTNVLTTRGERNDSSSSSYVNVGDMVNDGDNSPDYVNTPSRNSAVDDDLDYENVDVTADQMTTTTVTSTTSTQRIEPHGNQSKGFLLTSPGKAVSSDWIANISGDDSTSRDSDYIDMTAKSKTMSPNSKKKEIIPEAMLVGGPGVTMLHKNLRVVSPVYENQKPAVHREPKTTHL